MQQWPCIRKLCNYAKLLPKELCHIPLLFKDKEKSGRQSIMQAGHLLLRQSLTASLFIGQIAANPSNGDVQVCIWAKFKAGKSACALKPFAPYQLG